MGTVTDRMGCIPILPVNVTNVTVWMSLEIPPHYWNGMERKFFLMNQRWKGQYFVKLKLNKFADFVSEQLGSHFKSNEKIPWNLQRITWKNPWILPLRKSMNHARGISWLSKSFSQTNISGHCKLKKKSEFSWDDSLIPLLQKAFVSLGSFYPG